MIERTFILSPETGTLIKNGNFTIGGKGTYYSFRHVNGAWLDLTEEEANEYIEEYGSDEIIWGEQDGFDLGIVIVG